MEHQCEGRSHNDCKQPAMVALTFKDEGKLQVIATCLGCWNRMTHLGFIEVVSVTKLPQSEDEVAEFDEGLLRSTKVALDMQFQQDLQALKEKEIMKSEELQDILLQGAKQREKDIQKEARSSLRMLSTVLVAVVVSIGLILITALAKFLILE